MLSRNILQIALILYGLFFTIETAYMKNTYRTDVDVKWMKTPKNNNLLIAFRNHLISCFSYVYEWIEISTFEITLMSQFQVQSIPEIIFTFTCAWIDSINVKLNAKQITSFDSFKHQLFRNCNQRKPKACLLIKILYVPFFFTDSNLDRTANQNMRMVSVSSDITRKCIWQISTKLTKIHKSVNIGFKE